MRSRFLVVVVVVALVSSGLTWFVGRQIQSPGDRAAEVAGPEASLLTVPVESRVLSQNVVVRGTVKPSDSVEVLAVSEDDSSTVVTGLPKSEGDEVSEGDVVAEISARPVIALQGALPVFRELRVGVIGPDVGQLEESLARLGYNPGLVDDVYTATTGNAVAALYEAKGYPENGRSEDETEALRVARNQVLEGERSVAAAKKNLGEESPDLTEGERLQLDFAVTQAEEDLATARTVATEDPSPKNIEAVDAGETNLKIAEAARADRLNPPPVSEDDGTLAAAEQGLVDSRAEVERLETETGTSFPSAELVFVNSLPQQILQVNSSLGDEPSEAVLVISGSETVIRSAVSVADRKLLKEGMEAVIDENDLDFEAKAKVATIATKPGGGELSDSQYSMDLETINPLSGDIVDSSVRVTIPVTSSNGEVLVVPLAAVSAGPDGTSRVELQPKADSRETELVSVKVGLTADGLVEIGPLEKPLGEGDRVVIGQDLDLPDDQASLTDSDEE